MTVWSKDLSLFSWFMTPCGVSTGVLSFGDGIVVGAMGGGCGIWGELVRLAFCFSPSFLSFFLPFFFFLFFFSFSPLSLECGVGNLVASSILIHISLG